MRYLTFLGYTEGASVLDSASYVCSSEYGPLEWAMKKCNKDNTCKWLHDHGCDNENWRFCPNVDINKYLNPRAAQRSESCSKMKPNKEKIGNLNVNYFTHVPHYMLTYVR